MLIYTEQAVPQTESIIPQPWLLCLLDAYKYQKLSNVTVSVYQKTHLLEFMASRSMCVNYMPFCKFSLCEIEDIKALFACNFLGK